MHRTITCPVDPTLKWTEEFFIVFSLTYLQDVVEHQTIKINIIVCDIIDLICMEIYQKVIFEILRFVWNHWRGYVYYRICFVILHFVRRVVIFKTALRRFFCHFDLHFWCNYKNSASYKMCFGRRFYTPIHVKL